MIMSSTYDHIGDILNGTVIFVVLLLLYRGGLLVQCKLTSFSHSLQLEKLLTLVDECVPRAAPKGLLSSL